MSCAPWRGSGSSLGLTLLIFFGATMQDLLVQRFKDTFTGTPAWAWPVKPSVPLVGKNYKPGKSLLIYASAENLSRLNAASVPERFRTDCAWNRYRVQYEQNGRYSRNKFFPDVGIQPVTNGGLLAAGLFVAEKCGLPTRKTPRSFLETVAVSNWCKFSVKAASNRDYIADTKKLTASLPFVVGELVLLRPALVLIPKLVWRHPILQAAMWGASPKTRFRPVPQFNASVVNCHLEKYERVARRLQRHFRDTALGDWMGELEHFNHNNAWRYVAMLEKLLGE